MESESLIFTGLEIPRDYIEILEENHENIVLQYCLDERILWE